MDIGVMSQISSTAGSTSLMGNMTLTLGMLNLMCLKNIQVEISRKKLKYEPRTEMTNDLKV